MKAKSISHLLDAVHANPSMKQALLNDPLQFLESVEDRKPPINKTIYYLVIAILVGILVTCIYFAWNIFAEDIPRQASLSQFIISVGSTSLGAIIGLLIPVPGKSDCNCF